MVFTHPKHLPRFVLPNGDCFNARAVNFGEIARVIDDEGNRYEQKHRGADGNIQRRGKLFRGYVENVLRDKAHKQDLQHQRRSANDPDECFHQPFERFKF